MNEELENRLKELNVEEIIWGVYLIIIGLSFYSNQIERDYFLNKNEQSKRKYRELTITIFVLAILVYLYFVYDAYNDLKNLDINSNSKKVKFTYLNFIASALILIAGIILLYIAISDKDLDIEIAFV